jgi:subtilisin family serine protease
MKIQFQEDTYIRNNLGLPVTEPIGIVYKGAVLEVDDKYFIASFAINNNDRWYRDCNGWFYWSGGAELVPAEHAESAPVAVQPIAPNVPPAAVPVTVQPITPSVPPAAVPVLVQPVEPVTPPVFQPDPEPVIAKVPIGQNDPAQSTEPTVFLTKDKLPEGIVIPEGETRFVPEGGPVNSTPAPIARPEPSTASSNESIAGAILESSNAARMPSHIDWDMLSAMNLNWGVQHSSLARMWWQQHGLTGRGVKIALLSTGASQEHPDLSTAVDAVFSGLNDPSGRFEDLHGLGTQAAVLAAGSGRKVYGVAPEARLLIGRIGIMDQDITPAALIAGLEWALDSGADIIAMLVDFRILTESEEKTLQQLVTRALERNVLLVAPVGNSLERQPEKRFPAAMQGVLSVGAHNMHGERCFFSARSFRLDLLAPGEDLLTVGPEQKPVDNLKTTAIAAAYMAGFLALVRQWERQNNQVFNPSTVFDILRNTADPHNAITKGDDVEYGFGILNPSSVLNFLETK